jgi:hypothetical protein
MGQSEEEVIEDSEMRFFRHVGGVKLLEVTRQATK